MTIIQMHTACDELMDKPGNPWFNSTQKDFYLNEAIVEFTKERYAQFELNEKRREDLVSLVRKKSFTVPIITLNNINVPSFMYILALSASYTDICDNQRSAPVKPMKWDDYNESQRDPFNVPDNENPIYLTNNNGTVDIIDIKGITNFVSADLVYLKLPVTVLNDETNPTNNVNCDLPLATHNEIVNIAVRKMLGTVKDPNYQVQMNEIKTANT
jgi:hypothetical protein